jgi:hypothetical protein
MLHVNSNENIWSRISVFTDFFPSNDFLFDLSLDTQNMRFGVY